MARTTQERIEFLLKRAGYKTVLQLAKFYRVDVIRSVHSLATDDGMEPDTNEEMMESVYGEDLSQPDEIPEVVLERRNTSVLIASNPWTPEGFYGVGSLEDAWMYPIPELIDPNGPREAGNLLFEPWKAGDSFEVVRSSQENVPLNKRFKVHEPDTIGITQNVITRWRLRPLGD